MKTFEVKIQSRVQPKKPLSTQLLHDLRLAWLAGQELSGSKTNPAMSAALTKVAQVIGLSRAEGNWNQVIDWLDVHYPRWRGEWEAKTIESVKFTAPPPQPSPPQPQTPKREVPVYSKRDRVLLHMRRNKSVTITPAELMKIRPELTRVQCGVFLDGMRRTGHLFRVERGLYALTKKGALLSEGLLEEDAA